MTFWIPHSPDIPTSSWETPPAGIIATAHVPFKQSFFCNLLPQMKMMLKTRSWIKSICGFHSEQGGPSVLICFQGPVWWGQLEAVALEFCSSSSPTAQINPRCTKIRENLNAIRLWIQHHWISNGKFACGTEGPKGSSRCEQHFSGVNA